MNIKYIFKKKETAASIPAVKTDVPKVVFEDLELQVTVGQWLGILSSRQSYESVIDYTNISAEELIRKMKIPKAKFEEIERKFGLLLKTIGIASEETCTLNGYDKDNFSFKCHLKKSVLLMPTFR